MTTAERQQCMTLLKAAQAGDDTAFEPLTKLIVHHFKYMIIGYRSADPAYDFDDLLVQFQLGVWQSIWRVDHRGDPLFHLAERGRWAVSSMLTQIKQRRYGTAEWERDFGEPRSIGCIPEGWDPPDPRPENDPQYVVEVRESRDEAKRRVTTILSQVDLVGRDAEVLAWMIDDPEPDAKGANQRLAGCLGVSEQRASVLRQRVIRRLADE